MREFAENFAELNNTKVKVLIKHILWGKEKYYIDKLKIIDDDNEIGVIIKGHRIFMYKHNVQKCDIDGNVYMATDGRMEIIVTKL